MVTSLYTHIYTYIYMTSDKPTLLHKVHSASVMKTGCINKMNWHKHIQRIEK